MFFTNLLYLSIIIILFLTLCNKIVINTLIFMKLYLLHYFEKNNSLPIIDRLLVNSCMNIMCKGTIN